jgi:hypothetical protein
MRTNFRGRKISQEPKLGTQLRRIYDWFKDHPGQPTTSHELSQSLNVSEHMLLARRYELLSFGLKLQKVGEKMGDNGHKIGLYIAS